MMCAGIWFLPLDEIKADSFLVPGQEIDREWLNSDQRQENQESFQDLHINTNKQQTNHEYPSICYSLLCSLQCLPLPVLFPGNCRLILRLSLSFRALISSLLC